MPNRVVRSSTTSSLLKVLISLKMLQGGKNGRRGVTLEEISMHLVKNFGFDGDIKSQVLASLKYGVKLHFIDKRKERFLLILPGARVQLAQCKHKCDEQARISCLFPAVWDTCAQNDCDKSGGCCHRRVRKPHEFCPQHIICPPARGNQGCCAPIELPPRCPSCAKRRKQSCRSASPKSKKGSCKQLYKSPCEPKSSCSSETPFDDDSSECQSNTNCNY